MLAPLETVEIDDTQDINCSLVWKDCCTAQLPVLVPPGCCVVYRCLRAPHSDAEHSGMVWDPETGVVETPSPYESLVWVEKDGRLIKLEVL